MAVVLPFKGLRFTEKAGSIEQLVCPPYDIISDEQREKFLNTNEHNVIRLELPQEGEDVYKKASETLNGFEQDEILKQDEKESFYVYEEDFTVNGENKTLRGVIARVKLVDFDEGVVIPHENTLSAAKEDRFKLMCATGCNFSQVYCLFEDEDKNISNLLNDAANEKPLYDFTSSDGVGQKMWKLENADNITDGFKNKCLYIADGHHRYETALRYRDHMRENGASNDSGSEYVMMMLVPMESDGLVVFPTHRVVHSIENFNGRRMMLECRKFFHVGEMSTPENLVKNMKKEFDSGRISFGAYVNSRFFLMTLKTAPTLEESMPKVDKSLRKLDVSVLHSLILDGVMGIDKENMANQRNLSYTRDINEAVAAVNNGANCAFFLNPTRVSQIAAVGKSGQKMPQKSTYFYPKLITGLVLNKL